jgi:hypothetical protein
MGMKNYILTERERKILKKYLETDQKVNGFRGLKFRILQNQRRISQDVELIDQTIKKIQKET